MAKTTLFHRIHVVRGQEIKIRNATVDRVGARGTGSFQDVFDNQSETGLFERGAIDGQYGLNPTKSCLRRRRHQLKHLWQIVGRQQCVSQGMGTKDTKSLG